VAVHRLPVIATFRRDGHFCGAAGIAGMAVS
jgi:hypothetical protein